METIYIETTIPSFYYEVRDEPEMVARRNWTRQWWDEIGRRDFDLVTSQAVIDELSRGRFPGKDDALKLVNDLELQASCQRQQISPYAPGQCDDGSGNAECGHSTGIAPRRLTMKDDKAIEEIRSIRKQISEECDYDPHKFVQHYMRRQTTNARRLRKTVKRSSLRSES